MHSGASSASGTLIKSAMDWNPKGRPSETWKVISILLPGIELPGTLPGFTLFRWPCWESPTPILFL